MGTTVFVFVFMALLLSVAITASRIASTPKDHNKEGIRLAEQGRMTEALVEFRAATKQSPGRSDLWSNLGVTYMRMSQNEQLPRMTRFEHLKDAVDAYEMALVVDPSSSIAEENFEICRQMLEEMFPEECGGGRCVGKKIATERQSVNRDWNVALGIDGREAKDSANSDRPSDGLDLAYWYLEQEQYSNAFEYCSSDTVRFDLSAREKQSGQLSPRTLRRAIQVFNLCGVVAFVRPFDDDTVEAMRAAHKVQFGKFVEDIAADSKRTNTTTSEQRSPFRFELMCPMETPWTQDDVLNNPISISFAKAVLGGDRIEIDTFSHVTSQPGAPTQHWHRDAGHLFSAKGWKNHLQPHGVIQFIPLIDLRDEHGPTEFDCGSQILQESVDEDKHFGPLVHLSVPRGSSVFFDLRILHRGGANRSGEDRGIIYLAYVREWFVDKVNFNEKQTREFDSLPLNKRKLLSRMDNRKYTEVLETLLEAHGVDVASLQSAYEYSKHDLVVLG